MPLTGIKDFPEISLSKGEEWEDSLSGREDLIGELGRLETALGRGRTGVLCGRSSDIWSGLEAGFEGGDDGGDTLDSALCVYCDSAGNGGAEAREKSSIRSSSSMDGNVVNSVVSKVSD